MLSKALIDKLCFRVVYAICVTALSSDHALGNDNLSRAKQAVVQLYPQLKARDLYVGITDGGLLDAPGSLSDFVLSIQAPFQEVNISGPCPTHLLSIRFTFPIAGSKHTIFSLSAGGAAVEGDKLQRLDQVDSHPEWSDSSVLGALAKAGARDGPSAKKELLEQLPMEGLRQLMGGISVPSAEFQIRNEAQVREHLPSAVLMWAVKMKAQNEGQEQNYYVLLEPFEGRVVSIGRIPPVP